MTLRALLVILTVLFASAYALNATAHEVRPAFLQVTERGDGKVDVLFKQPSTTTLAVRLEPEISGGLLKTQPSVIDSGTGYQTLCFVDQTNHNMRIGWYTDTYARTAQGWRLKTRAMTFQRGYLSLSPGVPSARTISVRKPRRAKRLRTYSQTSR